MTITSPTSPSWTSIVLLIGFMFGLVAQGWLIPDLPIFGWLAYGCLVGCCLLCAWRFPPTLPALSTPSQPIVNPSAPARWGGVVLMLSALVVLYAPGWYCETISVPTHHFGIATALVLIGIVSALTLRRNTRWSVLLCVVVACFIVFLWHTSWHQYQTHFQRRAWGLQAYLITLALTGLAGIHLRRLEQRFVPCRPWQRTELLGLGVVLMIGFGARIYQLNTIPVEIADNETWHGWHEAGLFAQRNLFHELLFRGGHEDVPVLTFVNMTPFIKIFGNNLWAWRFSGVFFGLLSLFFLYLLIRLWFSLHLALIVTVLTAVWSVHLHQSRIGASLYIQALFFTTLAIWFWSRAALGYGFSNWLWCGLATGYGFQNYAATRIIPVLIIAFTVLTVWWQRPPFRQACVGLLLWVFATFVALGPFVPYIWHRHEQQTHRMTITVWGDSAPAEGLREYFDHNWLRLLWHQTMLNFGMFHVYAENPGEGPLVYGRDGPHLDPLTGPLLIIGLVGFLWVGWRDPRCWLFSAWGVITMIAGGVLTTQSPKIQRVLPVTPALMLLPGFGLWWICDTLRVVSSKQTIFAGVLLIFCAATINLYEFLFDYYNHYYHPIREKILWQAILSQDPTDRIFIISSPEDLRYQKRLFDQYQWHNPETTDWSQLHELPARQVVLIYDGDSKPTWVVSWLSVLSNQQTRLYPSAQYPYFKITIGEITDEVLAELDN